MNHLKMSLSLNHDRSRQDYSNLVRLVFLSKILFLVGFVLFIQACDRVAATREKENMSLTKNDPVHSVPRPPIDVSVPEKTETATFALG